MIVSKWIPFSSFGSNYRQFSEINVIVSNTLHNMSLRIFLFFFIIPLLAPTSRAQSVGQSDAKRSQTQMRLQTICHFGVKGFVAISLDNPADPRTLTLAYLAPAHDEPVTREVSLSVGHTWGQLEGAFRWGDRLTILSSMYYPGPRRNLLLLRQYRLPDLEEVAAQQLDEAYTPENLRVPFGYALSPDSSRLMYYAWSYTIPDDPPRLKVHVMDMNLQTVWRDNYVLPYRNQSFYVYGGLLDRQGGAYLLCENYEGRVSRGMQPRQDRINQIILYAEAGMEKPAEFAIRPGNLIASGLRFALDDQDLLVGAGFYSAKNKRRNDGIFTVLIDGRVNRLDHHLLPIDNNTYRDAEAGDLAFRPLGYRRGTFFEYTIDKMFFLDGALILTAERIAESTGDFYNPFIFSDILIARVANYRRLEWMRRIPRASAGPWEDAPLLSFNAFEDGDQLYLLYNLHSQAFGRMGPGTILARVSFDGQVRQTDIGRNIQEKEAIIPLPLLSWQLKDYEKLVLFGPRRGVENDTGALVILDWPSN
jgi:hypothetical protein